MPTYINDGINLGVALLSILNPIGVLPTFLSMTKDLSSKEITKISNSCSITVTITILISLFLGEQVLHFFGISLPSFSIGGGILIFMMSLSMLGAKNHGSKLTSNEQEKLEADGTEIGIVPLAIPLLSGPGTISTVIVKSNQIHGWASYLSAIVVILLAGVFIKLVFTSARRIGNRMGTLGLNIMTRIMGLILMSISIEMILQGIKDILPVLKG